MGYTHYFPQKRAFLPEQWGNIVAAVSKAIQHNVAGPEGEDKPVLNDSEITFNGIGENDSHEDFCITAGHDPSFNFCKTANKPYDKYVVAALCLCNHFAPGALDISSDGDASEWEDGRRLAEAALGAPVTLPDRIRL